MPVIAIDLGPHATTAKHAAAASIMRELAERNEPIETRAILVSTAVALAAAAAEAAVDAIRAGFVTGDAIRGMQRAAVAAVALGNTGPSVAIPDGTGN